MRCVRVSVRTWSSVIMVGVMELVAMAALADDAHLQRAATTLRIEAAAANTTADRLTLRVTIDNGSGACSPLYIDPALSPFQLPGRGLAKLTLTIRSDAGRIIEPLEVAVPDLIKLTPDRLLLLGCSAFYGVNIRPGASMWRYDLRPGTYTVQAALDLNTASAISLDEPTIRLLASRAAIRPTEVARSLRPLKLISNTIAVRVVK